MKQKITLGIVGVIILALLLSAMPALGQSTEMRIIWWGSQDRHDRTIEVIEMYEAAHPDLDIVFEFAGWGDYWTVINTQAAGGELPCIIQQDYRFLTEWQTRDLIIPLDQFIESGVIDTSTIPEANLASGRIDDELYGINLGNNSQAFVIDVDAFEAAGIELPPDNWTWEDFESISMQIHEATGKWAIGSTLPDIALWAALYIGNDEWIYNEDGTGLGYDNDEPLIEYFNMIKRLQDAGAIPNQEESAEFVDVGPEGAPIVTERAVMDYRWSNQVIAVTSAAGEGRNFQLVELPRPVGGQSENYLKPSMFFSITSQCDNPDEAAAFISYFVNDLEANEVLFAERGIPVSTVVKEHLLPMLEPAQAETFDFIAAIEADSSPVPPPDPAGAADLRDNVYTPLFVEPVLYGQISIEEGVAMLREEADRVLSEANE